jgi:hypothetical protein
LRPQVISYDAMLRLQVIRRTILSLVRDPACGQQPLDVAHLIAQVMQMLLSPNRWKHFTAMALIGDGVMAVVCPRHDALAWEHGPKPWQNLMHKLHDRPGLTRAIGAAQIIGGVWWALHHEKED